MQQLAKTLIALGVVLVLGGCLLLALQKVGFGRLPGDFTWRGRYGTLHLPIATSLVLSVVLTVLLNLWLGKR